MGESSMRKLLVTAVLVLNFSVPSLAADEFYVAQDPVAKDCQIVKEKPDGKTLVMLGTSSYPSRDAAKAAKKANPECKRAGD